MKTNARTTLTAIAATTLCAACSGNPSQEATGTANSAITTAAGGVATLFDAPTGQQHVFYRGSDNGIYQVFYDPQTNSVHGPEQWDTDLTGNFTLGDPATMSMPNQQHVFHISSFGTIAHVYYDSSTGRHNEQWTNGGAAIGGTPTAFGESNGQEHVFYRGSDTNIYHVFYDPWFRGVGTGGEIGVHPPEVWASEAQGNPTSMYVQNQQHVFYRDYYGWVWHVYYDESSGQRPNPEQWVGPRINTNDVAAASDVAPMSTPNGQQHIFYRGSDGNLYHVFRDPSANGLRGPELWCVGISGTPSARVSASGQQHVFFRGGGANQNEIFHIYYDPASNSLRTDGAWVGGAASDPATLFTPNGQQHVFYRGTNNGIYHVFYDPSRGRVGPEQWE